MNKEKDPLSLEVQADSIPQDSPSLHPEGTTLPNDNAKPHSPDLNQPFSKGCVWICHRVQRLISAGHLALKWAGVSEGHFQTDFVESASYLELRACAVSERTGKGAEACVPALLQPLICEMGSLTEHPPSSTVRATSVGAGNTKGEAQG